MTNTHVILVRHGETTANHEQRWYGALDAPLTERGQHQVQATGERFAQRRAGAPVDALYVSPLPRARSTAAAISAALDMEAIVDEGLREFSIGDWEGRTYQDLIDNEQLWARWAKDPTFAPPNGESPLSFGKRAVAAVQALTEAHPGERIVLVTHGGIISCLLDVWLGSGTGDWIRWDPHNCAVSELVWDGERWHGEVVNDISHLPPDAVIEVVPSYVPEMEKTRQD
ncbi:MAG: histidine phosphatase family protein [Caldilinea sp.]|nr:histidine phosphatase family protein [Caldilinea sp.]